MSYRYDLAGMEDVLYYVKKVLRVVGTLGFLAFISYLVFYTSIFYSLAKSNYDSRNASFHQKYQVNDYNDTKIIFYNKELEKYSKKFVDAEGMYDIFEARVKKDLALNCIEFFLKEHNESNRINMGSNFRRNARNKYANSSEKIKQAKKNEDYMGRHFYDYDLNDVNHIEDQIADSWDKNANKNTCKKSLSAEKMYEMFIVKYIRNRQDVLENDLHDSKKAKSDGVLSKSFYARKIKKTRQWLEMLREKHPDIYQQVQIAKETEQKET